MAQLNPWLRGPADGAKVNLLGEAVDASAAASSPHRRHLGWVCPTKIAISMEQMMRNPGILGVHILKTQTNPYHTVVGMMFYDHLNKNPMITSQYMRHCIPNISEVPSVEFDDFPSSTAPFS